MERILAIFLDWAKQILDHAFQMTKDESSLAYPKDPRRIRYEDVVEVLDSWGIYAQIKHGWPSSFPREGALLYEGNTTMRELHLDYDSPIDGDRGPVVPGAIVVDGNLTVSSLLHNGEWDRGPELIVLGDLDVKNAALNGASLWVAGNLRVSGVYHGRSNHGSLLVFGDVDASLFVTSEYGATLRGKVKGRFFDTGGFVDGDVPKTDINVEDALGEEFLEREDDDAWPNHRAIYEAVVAGLSISRR